MLPTIALLPLLLFQQVQEGVGVGPEPSPSPISWELELKFVAPKRIEVQLPGGSAPTVYWYVLYTVTNPTDRTQRWFPTFQIVTEDLRVIDTDMGIVPLVFDTIRELHKTTFPYLVEPTRAMGDLLTGDDHARESVAIWRDVDLSTNNFTIYVAGLSGETRFVRNQTYVAGRPETITTIGPNGQPRDVVVNPKYFVLRKTLEIRYTLPGAPESRGRAQPERQSVRWIMR